MPDARAADRTAEIYVGYLPVPRGYRTFLNSLVPALLCALVLAALLVARSQPNPGAAVWNDREPRTFTGILLARPYPVLYADDRGDGRPGALLVVEVGKHGAAARSAPYGGRRVTVAGTLLQRDGIHAIELAAHDSAIVPAATTSSTTAANNPAPMPRQPPTPEPLGPVTLRGEIVDSKCFLGAMKPGEGKTHKECATLCIAGGIPPMLITRDAHGRATAYLLLDPSGGPLDPAAHPFIADPVEATGDLDRTADLLRLRLHPQDIKRL